MTMTMAMDRRATAQRDMMTTTMVTGDDDNAVDGDGTTAMKSTMLATAQRATTMTTTTMVTTSFRVPTVMP